jgi:UDP-N-acetylglucosamine acyltransferase
MNKFKVQHNQNIHPSALIEDGAFIEEDVIIGPYCVIGKDVRLESRVRLVSHISITGYTCLGKNSTVYPFASIGHPPQDLKYNNEPSRTIIGSNTTIREHVTIQPGTKNDKMETRIGDNCLLMVGSHVAHDCIVGNNVIMANNATLAGHVLIDDHVIIGGLSAVQQHVHIGCYAMIGGMSGVEHDVIPYGLVMGERARLHGLNLIGLRRAGFKLSTIQKLEALYDDLFFVNDATSPLKDRCGKIKKNMDTQQHELNLLLTFIESRESRSTSLCLPVKKNIKRHF